MWSKATPLPQSPFLNAFGLDVRQARQAGATGIVIVANRPAAVPQSMTAGIQRKLVLWNPDDPVERIAAGIDSVLEGPEPPISTPTSHNP
jgi:hypothetical protein